MRMKLISILILILISILISNRYGPSYLVSVQCYGWKTNLYQFFASLSTGLASVPTQRLIFLIKHILQVSQSRVDFFKIRAEILKVLTIVLRSISDGKSDYSIWYDNQGMSTNLVIYEAKDINGVYGL
jgi:hypothetical protein